MIAFKTPSLSLSAAYAALWAASIEPTTTKVSSPSPAEILSTP